MTDKYDRHPSIELNEIFSEHKLPHQGQDPFKSEVVIIGLDANYSSDISKSPEFLKIIFEYHQDGVAFWKKYGVHHPFLLRKYPFARNTGGVPYHRKFTWLGLGFDFSEKISFLELLPFPTTGRTDSSKFWELFDINHASKIDDLVYKGDRRIILLSSSVMKGYMFRAAKRYGVFQWLPTEFAFGEIARIGKTSIVGAPHFSSTTYKKSVFEKVGSDIREFCQIV